MVAACNADQGYSICGDNTCSQSCASGVPTLDRRRSSRDNLGNCPKGQTACYVGGHGLRPGGRSWECLDTQTNIESCGGCQFPRDRQRQGRDCTEVDGADEISVSVHDSSEAVTVRAERLFVDYLVYERRMRGSELCAWLPIKGRSMSRGSAVRGR